MTLEEFQVVVQTELPLIQFRFYQRNNPPTTINCAEGTYNASQLNDFRVLIYNLGAGWRVDFYLEQICVDAQPSLRCALEQVHLIAQKRSQHYSVLCDFLSTRGLDNV